MRITWDDKAAEAMRLAEVRKRARKRLARVRGELPPLTKRQVSIVVQMMVDAYEAAQTEAHYEADYTWARDAQMQHEKRCAVSRRGVEARRKKSARMAIRAEFQAAQKAGKPVTAKQLVKKHGASPATVYRALRGLVKPPKR